jgi:DNA replication protein DnaC
VTAAAPAPPPLDDGLEQLLRRMRLPHMRRIAPEVIATAKAQRWDPAEVLRALLAEEVAGRDKSSLQGVPKCNFPYPGSLVVTS